jgi:pimeloyl-ACP methyl ester carboxylesterase
MINLRTHGNSPYEIAVIHGGPGVAGEMAPVARELSIDFGVLEPLQTEATLEGQIEELRVVLEKKGDPPMILIGYSWGAWLGFMLAAYNPRLVKKMVLVASGPFEDQYAEKIHETRMNRLSDEERGEAQFLMACLENPLNQNKNRHLARLGKLLTKADSYDPLSLGTEDLDVQYDIFVNVWKDAAEWRRSGKLLESGKKIQCPVVAIHGDYDPHPAEGIQKPLSALLSSFRFIRLQNCGHKPWIERQAKDKFFRILKDELREKK